MTQQSCFWVFIRIQDVEEILCIFMFFVALFSIAKRWKQSKCSFTDEWIKKM
jgi:hypothetical protein